MATIIVLLTAAFLIYCGPMYSGALIVAVLAALAADVVADNRRRKGAARRTH